MPFLQILLLAVLLPDGDSEDGENADPAQWVQLRVCVCMYVHVFVYI